MSKADGKSLSEYLRFQSWLLALVLAVFAIRLGFSVRWASLNALEGIGLLCYAVAVPLRGFGSYKQLLVLLFVQIALTHLLISLAIVLGIVTASQNMFTRPEFSQGFNGSTWLHAGLHLIAIAMLPFICWIIAAPILCVTKMFKKQA
jgi:hypothetical protein